MDTMGELARDPEHRRNFERLLYLACRRGDAEQVVERLRWGIDPNCVFKKGKTPLLGNIRSPNPNAGVVKALLNAGADPNHLDESGLTALHYARRKLAKLQARPRRIRKSPSLDENDQLQLSAEEQQELERTRAENPDLDPEFFRLYWQERLKAARRILNDPQEVEAIVTLLEAVTDPLS